MLLHGGGGPSSVKLSMLQPGVSPMLPNVVDTNVDADIQIYVDVIRYVGSPKLETITFTFMEI